MTDYPTFRQRLDAALRTLDIDHVRKFLVDEGQWSEGAPADPEFAMWVMIAGTPTLSNLHERAREWLVSHGHEGEAQVVLGKKNAPGGSRRERQIAQAAKDGKNRSQTRDGKPKMQGGSKRGNS